MINVLDHGATGSNAVLEAGLGLDATRTLLSFSGSTLDFEVGNDVALELTGGDAERFEVQVLRGWGHRGGTLWLDIGPWSFTGAGFRSSALYPLEISEQGTPLAPAHLRDRLGWRFEVDGDDLRWIAETSGHRQIADWSGAAKVRVEVVGVARSVHLTTIEAIGGAGTQHIELGTAVPGTGSPVALRHDDTLKVIDALSRAKEVSEQHPVGAGEPVYFPPGIYHLYDHRPAGSSERGLLNVRYVKDENDRIKAQQIGGIIGAGEASVLMGHRIPVAGRPRSSLPDVPGPPTVVLDLYGMTNNIAVRIAVRELKIRVADESLKTTYCMRVGNAKESFLADRVWFEGPNCVLLHVGAASWDSGGYAHINTQFRQCTLRTNAGARWFQGEAEGELPDGAPEEHEHKIGANVFALRSESKGGKWDNVRFESCMFVGVVESRGNIVEFQNCQFTVPPGRLESAHQLSPQPGLHAYSYNVRVRSGSARFVSCYFEDHLVAIEAFPLRSEDNGATEFTPIYSIVVDGCHFSGATNYALGSARNAVHLLDSQQHPPQIGSVSIRDTWIRDPQYSEAPISVHGGQSVELRRITRMTDRVGESLSLPVRLSLQAGNFSLSWVDGPGRGVQEHRFVLDEALDVPRRLAWLHDAISPHPTRFRAPAPCWVAGIEASIPRAWTQRLFFELIFLFEFGKPDGAAVIWEAPLRNAERVQRQSDSGMDVYVIDPPSWPSTVHVLPKDGTLRVGLERRRSAFGVGSRWGLKAFGKTPGETGSAVVQVALSF